jgi:hypothetical protein
MTALPVFISLQARRAALTTRMARDLVEDCAAQVKADAIAALHHRGYDMLDIMMVIDQARAEAFQEIVAREMMEP